MERKRCVDAKTLPIWDVTGRKLRASGNWVPPPAGLRLKYGQTVDAELNGKIALWEGDMTRLRIDAIVNAANAGLWAGGGVCGAIHKAAGPQLEAACEALGSCPTGCTVLTPGFRLPAKYVLHSVGPTNGDASSLGSCYKTCLDLCVQHKIRSVAFCCIATGIFGFNNAVAAAIALQTTRAWLAHDNHRSQLDKIVFCTFLDVDTRIYQRLTPCFFPLDAADVTVSEEEQKELAAMKEFERQQAREDAAKEQKHATEQQHKGKHAASKGDDKLQEQRTEAKDAKDEASTTESTTTTTTATAVVEDTLRTEQITQFHATGKEGAPADCSLSVGSLSLSDS